MRMVVFNKLRQATDWIRKKFTTKGLILMYHRVTEQEIDPWTMCVTSQHFAEQLATLQKEFNPISLRQLVQAQKEGKIPERAVAVTFDDGYADNLHNAKPLLEQYRIPATVFIANGHIGNDREFWWDELERILLQPGKLPESLTLRINGKSFKWELGDNTGYGKNKHQRTNENSGVVSCHENYRLNRSLYFTIHQLLQPLTEVDQNKVIEELLVWAGIKPVRRSTYRTLSVDELRTLSQGEFIEVGAHTVTHPLLSGLPESVQQDEVQRSKITLEESIGQQVRSFAYPYGSYTNETVAIIRKAGFDCACSTTSDSVWRGNDRFQLPRVTVEDWDGEEFKQRLLKWITC